MQHTQNYDRWRLPLQTRLKREPSKRVKLTPNEARELPTEVLASDAPEAEGIHGSEIAVKRSSRLRRS